MNNMKKNILYLVYSKGISRIGDVMFDYANNRFLAGINPTSLSLVAIYQSLESVIGVLFNLFGGVIADSFNRKKIIIATNILCGLSCITLSFISQEQVFYSPILVY